LPGTGFECDAVSNRHLQRSQHARFVTADLGIGQVGQARLVHRHAPARAQLHAPAEVEWSRGASAPAQQQQHQRSE